MQRQIAVAFRASGAEDETMSMMLTEILLLGFALDFNPDTVIEESCGIVALGRIERYK